MACNDEQTATAIIQTRTKGTADGRELSDAVSIEAPLEIRLGCGPLDERRQAPIAITMRTPGQDENLALGFLLTEGIIQNLDEVKSIGPCGSEQGMVENVVRVELQASTVVDLERFQRHFYTTSSCGICGKQSLAALRTQSCFSPAQSRFWIAAEKLYPLPQQLLARQRGFATSGSLHAAAAFDRDGNILHVREDVGRHNALDKLIGICMRERRLPLEDYAILVSGRASFELLQKTIMAGCPLLAAIGGPSSLAVDAAHEFGVTLVGFLQNRRLNIYTGAQRVG